MHGVIGAMLIAHGVITSAIGFGTVSNPGAPAMAMPGFMSWWPGPFGRSWLFDTVGLGSSAAVVGGAVWLLSGLALVAGGLGWLGVGGVLDLRYALLVAGAGLGLLAVLLYFHPFYLVAVLINLAIVALFWTRVTAAA
jgi:hypothetical protein